MTDADIKRLRALCEAATPGPWTAQTVCDTDSDDWCAVGPTHLYADDDPAVDDGDPHPAAEADAAFIAAARTALPALLDEVEGLRAEGKETQHDKEQAVLVFRKDRDRSEKLRDEALLALDTAQAERDDARRIARQLFRPGKGDPIMDVPPDWLVKP